MWFLPGILSQQPQSKSQLELGSLLWCVHHPPPSSSVRFLSLSLVFSYAEVGASRTGSWLLYGPEWACNQVGWCGCFPLTDWAWDGYLGILASLLTGSGADKNTCWAMSRGIRESSNGALEEEQRRPETKQGTFGWLPYDSSLALGFLNLTPLFSLNKVPFLLKTAWAGSW